jgi:hypothetical protein
MKKILFIIGLFISFLSNAQSINELEHNNGFKSLKLNSHISSLKNNLSLIENIGGYSTYKYVEAYEIVYEYITLRKKVRLSNRIRKEEKTLEKQRKMVFLWRELRIQK